MPVGSPEASFCLNELAIVRVGLAHVFNRSVVCRISKAAGSLDLWVVGFCGCLMLKSSSVKGRSSIGRAAVSKTASWGFESLRPCLVN